MLRLGGITYLNAQPLLWGLAGHPEVELQTDLPSRMADYLAQGKVEAAIVPVVECLRGGLSILPGPCIGSEGKVGSVLLFLGRPLEQVSRVALDESSRTSAALARVLLSGWGRDCWYVQSRPGLEAMLTRANAALMIGDPALQEVARTQRPALDLGEEWTKLSGLPFVYAVWAARPGYDWGPAREVLAGALEQGLAHREEIAALAAARLKLPEAVCREYISARIQYRMTERYLAGLAEFGRRCRALGLVGEDWEPRLWPG